MTVTLDPTIVELTQSGATAALLLDAQKHLCGLCVEEVLKKIDRVVSNQTVTPEFCVGVVHELAAYRRIVTRQQQQVDMGRAAAQGVMNG